MADADDDEREEGDDGAEKGTRTGRVKPIYCTGMRQDAAPRTALALRATLTLRSLTRRVRRWLSVAVCTLPLEYCEFQPTFDKCKEQVVANWATHFPDVTATGAPPRPRPTSSAVARARSPTRMPLASRPGR